MVAWLIGTVIFRVQPHRKDGVIHQSQQFLPIFKFAKTIKDFKKFYILGFADQQTIHKAVGLSGEEECAYGGRTSLPQLTVEEKEQVRVAGEERIRSATNLHQLSYSHIFHDDS